MKRIITVTVMVSAVLLASKAAPGQARKTQVDDYIRAELTKRHIPGAGVAVLRNGKVELKKGYGLANVERKIPVTPNTMFQIASTTKSFTAKVAFGSSSFTGSTEGVLIRRPGFQGVSVLEFQLRREGKRMIGICDAYAKGYFELAHWVELDRQS